MKKIFLLTICLALLSGMPAFADLEKGMQAYNKGDYETALREWQPLAEQGLAGAQVNLGLMYQNGHGVAQDYQEAIKWYELAAKQGHANAQHNLGVMYHDGYGVPQDYQRARELFNLAAKQGFADSQRNLATIYASGRGAPKNYIIAYMWAELSIINGLKRSSKIIDALRIDMIPAQITEAKKMTQECLKRNYHKCSVVSPNTPVLAGDFNKGLKAYENEDYDGALDEWIPLAEQEHAFAQAYIFAMLSKGITAFQNGDFKTALNILRTLSERGNADAQLTLGRVYQVGKGTLLKPVQSYMWYSIATLNGKEDAIDLRNGLEKEMTPEQIAEAERLTRECIDTNYKECG